MGASGDGEVCRGRQVGLATLSPSTLFLVAQFGCFACDLLCGRGPFAAFTDTPSVQALGRRGGRVQLPTTVTPHARSFVEHLLAFDSAARLQTFDAVRAHPFFAGFDWESLLAGKTPSPVDVISAHASDSRYFAPTRKRAVEATTTESAAKSAAGAAKTSQFSMGDASQFTSQSDGGLKTAQSFGDRGWVRGDDGRLHPAGTA